MVKVDNFLRLVQPNGVLGYREGYEIKREN